LSAGELKVLEVVEPTLATPEGAEPPHAAASSTIPTSVSATKRVRDSRDRRLAP
jgi:hypothetical protein